MPAIGLTLARCWSREGESGSAGGAHEGRTTDTELKYSVWVRMAWRNALRRWGAISSPDEFFDVQLVVFGERGDDAVEALGAVSLVASFFVAVVVGSGVVTRRPTLGVLAAAAGGFLVVTVEGEVAEVGVGLGVGRVDFADDLFEVFDVASERVAFGAGAVQLAAEVRHVAPRACQKGVPGHSGSPRIASGSGPKMEYVHRPAADICSVTAATTSARG